MGLGLFSVNIRGMRHSFAELFSNRFKNVPDAPGIYIVYVKKDFKPELIKPGTGGFFKGRDSNVTKEKLEQKWVDSAEILYIGKTNGSLRERVALYAAFGAGYPVAHWGGRYIWQIKNAMKDLYVCWKTDDNPRKREKNEIAEFEKVYNKLPFANLKR